MIHFADRLEAGGRLGEALAGRGYDKGNALVLGIARGGVVVGYGVTRALGLPFEVISPRKLPIPWNPEAGFGAIAEDGSTFLNESLVVSIGITEEDIRESNSSVLREIRRRVAEYRGGRELPRLKGKTAILVDDGLASGYTMVAAIRMVKNLTPENTVVAVPVSSGGAYDLIRSFVDDIVCLHVQEYGEFAVASYYNEFPELSDEEVLELLENARGNKR